MKKIVAVKKGIKDSLKIIIERFNNGAKQSIEKATLFEFAKKSCGIEKIKEKKFNIDQKCYKLEVKYFFEHKLGKKTEKIKNIVFSFRCGQSKDQFIFTLRSTGEIKIRKLSKFNNESDLLRIFFKSLNQDALGNEEKALEKLKEILGIYVPPLCFSKNLENTFNAIKKDFNEYYSSLVDSFFSSDCQENFKHFEIGKHFKEKFQWFKDLFDKYRKQDMDLLVLIMGSVFVERGLTCLMVLKTQDKARGFPVSGCRSNEQDFIDYVEKKGLLPHSYEICKRLSEVYTEILRQVLPDLDKKFRQEVAEFVKKPHKIDFSSEEIKEFISLNYDYCGFDNREQRKSYLEKYMKFIKKVESSKSALAKYVLLLKKHHQAMTALFNNSFAVRNKHRYWRFGSGVSQFFNDFAALIKLNEALSCEKDTVKYIKGGTHYYISQILSPTVFNLAEQGRKQVIFCFDPNFGNASEELAKYFDLDLWKMEDHDLFVSLKSTKLNIEINLFATYFPTFSRDNVSYLKNLIIDAIERLIIQEKPLVMMEGADGVIFEHYKKPFFNNYKKYKNNVGLEQGYGWVKCGKYYTSTIRYTDYLNEKKLYTEIIPYKRLGLTQVEFKQEIKPLEVLKKYINDPNLSIETKRIIIYLLKKKSNVVVEKDGYRRYRIGIYDKENKFHGIKYQYDFSDYGIKEYRKIFCVEGYPDSVFSPSKSEPIDNLFSD
ncbi:hypothetical protein ACFLZV_07105 [Candidatus Margulisiibacteriota bacterium]